MRIEPATIIIIEVGSLIFFGLLLPLVVVLARLRAIWRADRPTGLVLAGVILFSSVFFALFFIRIVAVMFFGVR